MNEPITYKNAGVNIDAGNEAVERIKKILKSTPRSVPGGEEYGSLGGFAGLFEPNLKGMSEPLLVGSTDGVGTKLLIALEHNRLEGIGQDLVAMCVNDLIACGARPLFFLDYLATAKLDPDQVESIVGSINRACVESECLLIGGECAEMPGMYAPGHTDLAGNAIGIVDKSKVIDGSTVKAGDVILGLGSSGVHSNGFSLVRKLIEKEGWKLSEIPLGCDKTYLDIFLVPTRLYVKPIMRLIEKFGAGESGVKALAHITGGGLIENIPRVVPSGLTTRIRRGSWEIHPIFKHLQDAGKLDENELLRTFNCGIGFVVIVADELSNEASKALIESGENVFRIGEIILSKGELFQFS